MLIRILFLLLPILSMGQSLYEDIDNMMIKKQYYQAENKLLNYLESNPKQEEALQHLGNIYILQKKWGEAQDLYHQLVVINPNSASYHYLLGKSIGMNALKGNKLYALFSINDVKNAFQTTLQLDPNHIDAHWGLIVFYTELPGIIGGSIENALILSDELKKISPVDGYLAKGYIYEYEENLLLAEENYNKAIITGRSYTCYNKLISFYKKHEHFYKALYVIEEALQETELDTLHFQYGEISATQQIELKKGEMHLKKYLSSLSIEKEKKWSYYYLALLNNNDTDASRFNNKALDIDPNFKPALKEKKRLKN